MPSRNLIAENRGSKQIQDLDQRIVDIIAERDLLLEQIRQVRICAADQDRDRVNYSEE